MAQTAKKIQIPLIYLALALTTFVAFEPVRYNDFVGYDDPFYVTNNPHVNNGITFDSAVWAFTNTLGANWHPLTSLSHMLDCEFFGLNPLCHHLMNLLFHIASALLLFHIASALLLFGILKRMTGEVWLSAFVAAVFALHPLNVESVAWTSERKSVLSTFFWMLTIAAYIRYAEHSAIKRYLLVVLALGRFQWPHLSKTEALPNFESVKLSCQSSPLWRLIAEKIPLCSLAAASSIITYIVQQSKGAMKMGEYYPLNLRISNALVSYLVYIGKLIYPTRLAVLYPYPADGLPTWQPVFSLLVLAGASAGIIYIACRWRYLTVGWLWYLGTLVPVIGLVQVGNQARADRYMYLPMLGLLIMIAWGIATLTAGRRYRRIGLGISASIVIIALLICTRKQIKYWQNSSALYQRALKVTENNYIMHSNYGASLTEDGRYDEALKHLNRALQISPRYYYAHHNLGRVFLKQEKFDEATEYFNKALHLKPDYHKAYFGLGVALLKQSKTDQAIDSWKRALRLKPDYSDANYNIGAAMTEQGKYDEALKYFTNALLAQPNWPEAYYEMGRVYYLQGNRDLAIKHCTEALRIKPDYITARVTLAHTLVEIGNIQPAIEHYYKALQLDPNHVYVLKNLAWILATTEDVKLHNPRDAVELAERACELTDYKQIEAMDTLAVAYSAAGRFPEAVQTAEKAIELALSAGEKNLADEIQKRLQLYNLGQPYRQPQSRQRINHNLINDGIIKTE
ncbi:MAG: tetratricopeptide repeat protein [Planctomycetota bacterium]|jgi:tetratricopeptide (TPR) repeat protein